MTCSIWLIRTGITAYYKFRVDSLTQRLENQQAERVKTIEKLKAATKYNSTQELLEKYGGAPPKPKPEKKGVPSKSPKNTTKQPPRTSLGPPPPTANIQRPNPVLSQPSTPQSVHRSSVAYTVPPLLTGSPQAEFAPNAFSAPPQYALGDSASLDGHWYDRVLDLLLGEDEVSSKNRIVLICGNCRLVNGQAPPGTKTLMDLGKWRCIGCGTMNGEEDEAVKAVKEMKEIITEKSEGHVSGSESKSGSEPDVAGSSELKEGDSKIDQNIVEPDVGSDSDAKIVKPTKGRSKSNRKKDSS
jgi:hypothetical protein